MVKRKGKVTMATTLGCEMDPRIKALLKARRSSQLDYCGIDPCLNTDTGKVMVRHPVKVEWVEDVEGEEQGNG